MVLSPRRKPNEIKVYADFNVMPQPEHSAQEFEIKTMHSVRFYFPSDIGNAIASNLISALVSLCESNHIAITREDVNGQPYGGRYELAMSSPSEDEIRRARALVDELLVVHRFQLSEHSFKCVRTAGGLRKLQAVINSFYGKSTPISNKMKAPQGVPTWLGLREEERAVDVFCAPDRLSEVLAALNELEAELGAWTEIDTVMYLQPHAPPADVLRLARDLGVTVGALHFTPAQLIATVAGSAEAVARFQTTLRRPHLLRTKEELGVARNAGPACWHCHRALTRADAGIVMIKCCHMTCTDCLSVLLERCRVTGFRCPACADEDVTSDMSLCDIPIEGIMPDVLRTLYLEYVWDFFDKQKKGTLYRCPTRYCMEIQRPHMLRVDGTLPTNIMMPNYRSIVYQAAFCVHVHVFLVTHAHSCSFVIS